MNEAAFGYYPQLKPKRSKQDPEAAKNVPADVLRGRIAGTLGAFGDVANVPNPMVRPLQLISQLLTKKDKYFDTDYMLENLPFKNDAPVSQAAGRAASFVPMNPAPLARAAKAIPKMVGEVLNDRALKGQGLIPGLPGQPPVAMFAAPPEPKMSSPHGKGWWYNTENKRLLPIESGDLGPHGDHDGWIGVGNNAEKLGVDPAVALRFQEGSYGFMASKEDVQKALQRGEIDPKDIAKNGEYYYSKSYGDSVPTFDEVFERKHGSSMEEAAFSGLPEELNSLVRIRQWPSGMFTYSMQTQPDNRVVQDIVNTMDQLPGFWKAPKVLALLEDGAYAYTLSPENFSRVKSVKDFSKFNDETLAKSSEVTQAVKAETPPPSPYTQEVLSLEERRANLAKMLEPSAEKGQWYHGTGDDFKVFNPELSKEKPNQAVASFVSEDIPFAESFANDAPDFMMKKAEKYLTPDQMQQSVEKAKKYFTETYGKDMPEHAEAMIKSLDSGKPVGEAQDELFKSYRDMLPSGPNMMPVNVQVKKPFDPAVSEHVEELRAINPNLPFDKITQTAVLETPDVQKAIQDAQFDAFYTNEGGVRNLGIYDPKKIKSSIGNRGTYDVTNEDINYKDGGSVKSVRKAMRQKLHGYLT